MIDIETYLTTLKRPRLLAQAAKFGVDDYRRDVHLPRLLEKEVLPRPAAAIMALRAKEAEQENWRQQNDGHYRPSAHVATLIAILGEARLWRATTLSPR